MQPIRVAGFDGANRAFNPKLLPDNVGVESVNQWPDKGDLRPWHVPLNVATAPAGTRTIYRFNRDTASDVNYWFTWSTIVHAVRGFIADDTTERTYYTGSGAPKVTDNLIGLAGAPYPTAFRDLGVPKPLTAPILAQTAAGTGDDEDRFYVYTYLTDWDEESAPSPVSAVVTCKPGATFDITNIAAPPGGSSTINRMRIYRTQSGTTGTNEFYFLSEVSIGISTVDDGSDVGSDTLQSNGPDGELGRVWLPPPADLHGLVPLWNGIMAGITGKSVRYCEPFKPHAWPAAFETLCTDTPVALVTFSTYLLILTTGSPRLAYGTSPEVIADDPVPFIGACVSAQGVVGFKHGACWPTADGLAYMGVGVPPGIITSQLNAPDWKALHPETMVGGQFNGRYMGFFNTGAGWNGLMIDPLNPDRIFFFDTGFSAVYFDELQEAFYVLDGLDIRKWDAGSAFMTARFRSKVFRVPSPANPAVAEVIADAYPVTFRMWADGNLKITKTVTSRDTFTLPWGYMADDFQLEGETTGAAIIGMVIAESIEDIQKV